MGWLNRSRRCGPSPSDQRLTGVFTHIGKRYGVSKVKARFTDMEGTKVRWDRRGSKVDIKVSRYYENASEAELARIAEAAYHDMATQPLNKRSEVLISG